MNDVAGRTFGGLRSDWDDRSGSSGMGKWKIIILLGLFFIGLASADVYVFHQGKKMLNRVSGFVVARATPQTESEPIVSSAESPRDEPIPVSESVSEPLSVVPAPDPMPVAEDHTIVSSPGLVAFDASEQSMSLRLPLLEARMDIPVRVQKVRMQKPMKSKKRTKLYVLSKGESLSLVFGRHAKTVCKWNGIRNCDMVRADRLLRIPTGVKVRSVPRKSVQTFNQTQTQENPLVTHQPENSAPSDATEPTPSSSPEVLVSGYESVSQLVVRLDETESLPVMQASRTDGHGDEGISTSEISGYFIDKWSHKGNGMHRMCDAAPTDSMSAWSHDLARPPNVGWISDFTVFHFSSDHKKDTHHEVSADMKK